MKRGFAILAEPANYTLDLITHIYEPRKVDFAFLANISKASDMTGESFGKTVIEKLSFCQRVKFIWSSLRTYDFFIVNGYTVPFCICFVLIDILFFKKPYLFDSDTELQVPPNHVKRFLKALFLRFLFKREYAYGLAGGNYSHKDLFRYYGMSEERIGVTPMMVDNTRYSQAVTVRDVSKPFRFGYLGRLIPLKQVDKILQAYKRLIDEKLDITFEIVGDGESRETLEKQYGSLKGVTFHGVCFGDEKIRELHEFDCMVLYSWYESWGLVVNEALASGIPCIISDKVGARNDLVGGEKPTGLIVPFDDMNALVNAMRQMVEDKMQYAEFQKNALVRMAHWNFDFYGRSFDRILEKL